MQRQRKVKLIGQTCKARKQQFPNQTQEWWYHSPQLTAMVPLPPLLLLSFLTLLLCHWLHHAYCYQNKYIICPLSFLNYFCLPSILLFFFHSFLPCSLPSHFLPPPPFIFQKKQAHLVKGERWLGWAHSRKVQKQCGILRSEVRGQKRWRYWCTLVIPENEIGGMLGIDQVKSKSSWNR